MLSVQDPKVVGCCDEMKGFMTVRYLMIVWFINDLIWQNN